MACRTPTGQGPVSMTMFRSPRLCPLIPRLAPFHITATLFSYTRAHQLTFPFKNRTADPALPLFPPCRCSRPLGISLPCPCPPVSRKGVHFPTAQTHTSSQMAGSGCDPHLFIHVKNQGQRTRMRKVTPKEEKHPTRCFATPSCKWARQQEK